MISHTMPQKACHTLDSRLTGADPYLSPPGELPIPGKSPEGTVQPLDFTQLSADRLGGDVHKWLDESVPVHDIAETDWDETELGGEGWPLGLYHR
jgi:hypothetical protein